MPLASRTAAILILIATLSGCSPRPSLPPLAAPFVLVTVAADATSTATPYQPDAGSAQPVPSERGQVAVQAQFVPFPYLDSPASVPVAPACGPYAGWVSYTVQPGDTLESLSRLFAVSRAALELANCTTGPFLTAGQKLYVPYQITGTSTGTTVSGATASPTSTLTPSASATRTRATGTAAATVSSTASPTRTILSTPRTATAPRSSTASATWPAHTTTPTTTSTATVTRVPATTSVIVDPHYTGISSPAVPVTQTFTPTLTPTATPSSTPIPPTATATPALNQPGQYTFTDQCVLLGIPETTITVDYCLVSVSVATDGSMRFDLAWTPHLEGSGYDYVEIYSDAGNTGLYLTDDKGTNYGPYGLLGLAAFGGYLGHNETGYSGYFFPPPDPDSRSFRFTNDAVGAVFANIVLAR